MILRVTQSSSVSYMQSSSDSEGSTVKKCEL